MLLSPIQTIMKIIFKLIPIFILLFSCNQNRDNDKQNLNAAGPPEQEMMYLGQTLPAPQPNCLRRALLARMRWNSIVFSHPMDVSFSLHA
jgi:hypothetical protein